MSDARRKAALTRMISRSRHRRDPLLREIVGVQPARSDWREHPLGLDDLAALPEMDADRLVRKEHIWPEPDWAALVAAGCEPIVAALVKELRHRLPSRPPAHLGDASSPRDRILVRRDFVRMVSLVRDRLLACRTRKDVIGVRRALLRELGLLPGSVPIAPAVLAENRHLWATVSRLDTDPLSLTDQDLSEARQAVFEGWPGPRLAWRKGVAVVHGRSPGDSASGWMVVAAGSTRLLVSTVFATEAQALAWIDGAHRAAVEASGRSTLAVTRPDLAHVRRDGLPARRSGAIVTDEIRIAFGFRSVSLAPTTPPAEARAILEMTWDAFHDLADVLELPPATLSLAGRLSLVIGGRAGGTTSAFYMPGNRTITLTRLDGAGALAHEWTHGFDHFVGDLGFSPEERRRLRGAAYASGGAVRVRDWDHRLARLAVSERAAWIAFIDALYGPDGGRSDFSRDARRLAVLRKPYWNEPAELVARAGEAAVFELLQARQARSDYLVSSAVERAYRDPQGRPVREYPVAHERRAIAAQFRALVHALSGRMTG